MSAVMEQEAPPASGDLLAQLRARTAPGIAGQARRAKVYNHPKRWFCKPDGDIVLLQADPQNRSYYEDKGYALLRDDEARQWERELRPKVVAMQREKAAIITTLRDMSKADTTIKFVADFDVMDLDELRTFVESVSAQTGRRITVVKGRTRDEIPDIDTEPLADVVGVGGAERMAESIKRARSSGRHYGSQEG